MRILFQIIAKLAAECWPSITVALFATVIANLCLNHVSWLGHLELSVNQWRLVNREAVQPSDKIVIIAIDNNTPSRLKLQDARGLIPRSYHAKLIRGLRRTNARALVFDLTFCQTSNQDEELRDALSDKNDFALPITLAAELDNQQTDTHEQMAPTAWLYSFHQPVVMPAQAASITIASPVAFNPGQKLDGAILLLDDANTGRTLPYLALSAFLAYNHLPSDAARWDRERGLVTAERFSWPVGQDGELHVHWTSDLNSFQQYEYADALKLLDSRDGAKQFDDKIILVGGDAAGMDSHLTLLGRINGPQFVAQVLNTMMLMNSSSITRWKILNNSLWCWFLALGVVVAIRIQRALTIIGGLLTTLGAALILPSLFLHFQHIWIDTVGPCLSIICAAIAMSLTEGVRSGALARRFIPDFVRERRPNILTEEATVMFVDMCNSTDIAARIGAESARDIQSQLLQHLSSVIIKHGGEVERTLGDGLMAIFRKNGKIHHAVRCVSTINSLHEAALEVDTRLRTSHNLPVGITIGIESGIVSGGIVKSAKREEWSSFGPTVNLAARLQSACKQQNVTAALGPRVRELVQNQFSTVLVGTLPLKGISEPTQVYRLQV